MLYRSIVEFFVFSFLSRCHMRIKRREAENLKNRMNGNPLVTKKSISAGCPYSSFLFYLLIFLTLMGKAWRVRAMVG